MRVRCQKNLWELVCSFHLVLQILSYLYSVLIISPLFYFCINIFNFIVLWKYLYLFTLILIKSVNSNFVIKWNVCFLVGLNNAGIKINTYWSGVRAQELGVSTALSEEPLVSNTQIIFSQLPVTPSPQNLTTSSGICGHVHSYMHKPVQGIRMHVIKMKSIFYKTHMSMLIYISSNPWPYTFFSGNYLIFTHCWYW